MADVASSFKNWSSSAASNSPTSSTTIGSGLAPNLQQIQATLRSELGTRSASITAASTVDIGSKDEGTVLVSHVSGTVAITSFGTVSAGIKKLVTFSVSAGTLTLTYNATSMILPSSANISVSDGDSLIAESLGSGNWKIHVYQKANGQAIAAPTTVTATSDPTFADSSDNPASTDWGKGISLGWGQTWQNVTASRAKGTTYTNSTNKPIAVLISQIDGTSGIRFNINGNVVASAGNGATGADFVISAIILPGETYSLSNQAGPISRWWELRA